MKIVAGTDGSSFSKQALEEMGKLLDPSKGEVVLVAAFPDPSMGALGFMGPPYLDTATIGKQVQQEAETFAKEGAEILRAAGFEVRTEVLSGDPATILLDMVDREQADLVVVGSHGRTGVSRFLLGSVSDRVATHAPCAVLVVRSRAHAA